MTMESTDTHNVGATAVITHRVHSDKHAEYERWLNEMAPTCRAAPGHLDWHIVRPLPGLTETYTMIVRFDTAEHLRGWMGSGEREQLIEKVTPLLAAPDDFYISSGLDFWFAPAGAKAKLPTRWKQYLLTWSAIFPLVLGVPYLASPVLELLGIAGNHVLSTLAVTAVIVFLMVYVIMPRYTRLVQQWLFR